MSAASVHLYVHTPFCVHKCAYCDFNSHVRAEPAWDDYRKALLAELAHWKRQPQFSGRHVSTVFFGGGTPSLAPAGLIGDVLECADRLFGIDTQAEITLEANPGSSETGRFADYKTAGINRLSIGVQSFDDVELHWLERIHDSAQALHAYEAARRAGFDNLSLDLIYGLPGQPMGKWMHSLETAIALAPEHMSCYQLTIEAHTELARRHRLSPLDLPGDDAAWQFLHQTRARLHDSGYAAYEVSNFATRNHHCRHNDAYWLYRDYIGIGAGAAGKRDEADGGITRHANIRSPEGYMRAALSHGRAVNSQERLDRNKAAAEAVWLGLRRSRGIDRAAFARRFGFDAVEHFGAALTGWRDSGHLCINDAELFLTPEGLGMADSIAADVLVA